MTTTFLQHSLPQRVAIAQNAWVEPGMRFFLLRESKNESQQTLSSKTGGLVTDQTISNFEVGKTKRMQPKIWQAIAQALNMNVDELNAAVYGETIVMAVPAKLGDYVLALIEKSKQAESKPKSTVERGELTPPREVPKESPSDVEKKSKRRDTTSGSAH